MTTKENTMAYIRKQPFTPDPGLDEISFRFNCQRVAVIDVPICERPYVSEGFDCFGVHWSRTEGASHYTPGQKPIYDDIENWRNQVRIPNPDKYDWDIMRNQVSEVDRDQFAVAVELTTGPFERASVLTSMEDCLVNAISDPENFSDLISALTDYRIKVFERIAKACHPDIYLIHDDWGTARSPFMSPDLWRQVIAPHLPRAYQTIHDLGGIVIQHSCGNVTPILEDIFRAGADGWEGQASCNDFPALETKYGNNHFFVVNEADLYEYKTIVIPPLHDAVPAYPEVPTFLFE